GGAPLAAAAAGDERGLSLEAAASGHAQAPVEVFAVDVAGLDPRASSQRWKSSASTTGSSRKKSVGGAAVPTRMWTSSGPGSRRAPASAASRASAPPTGSAAKPQARAAPAETGGPGGRGGAPAGRGTPLSPGTTAPVRR